MLSLIICLVIFSSSTKNLTDIQPIGEFRDFRHFDLNKPINLHSNTSLLESFKDLLFNVTFDPNSSPQLQISNNSERVSLFQEIRNTLVQNGSCLLSSSYVLHVENQIHYLTYYIMYNEILEVRTIQQYILEIQSLIQYYEELRNSNEKDFFNGICRISCAGTIKTEEGRNTLKQEFEMYNKKLRKMFFIKEPIISIRTFLIDLRKLGNFVSLML